MPDVALTPPTMTSKRLRPRRITETVQICRARLIYGLVRPKIVSLSLAEIVSYIGAVWTFGSHLEIYILRSFRRKARKEPGFELTKPSTG
jgi:hypothetical protein